MTTFLSSALDMPVYTSEYFPFPIFVMISNLSMSLNVSMNTRTKFRMLHSYNKTRPCVY